MIWSVPLQWRPRIGPLHVATPLPSGLMRSGRLGTQLLSLRSLPGSIGLHLFNHDRNFTFGVILMSLHQSPTPTLQFERLRAPRCAQVHLPKPSAMQTALTRITS